MKTPHERIKEFCSRRNISILHEGILLEKFYKHFDEIINDYKKREGKSPSNEIISGFKNSLLSESILIGNLRLAQDEIKNELEQKMGTHRTQISVKNFFVNVAASVLGAIIFALLLLLFLIIAQNPDNVWVNELMNTTSNFEQCNYIYNE